jgi:hypothetical protein
MGIEEASLGRALGVLSFGTKSAFEETGRRDE